MKKHYLLSAILAAALFAGCNDDNGSGYKDDGNMDVIVCIDRPTGSIVAMKPDGTGAKVLFFPTHEAPEPQYASIGSDARTLLFTDNSSGNIYTHDIETGITTTIYTNEGSADDRIFETPAFSPNMKKIFAYDNNNLHFCSIDVATGAITVIYDANEADHDDLSYPSFLNDNTMVCNYGDEDIASIKTDGTGFGIIKECFEEEDGNGNWWGVYYMHPATVWNTRKIVYVKNEYDDRDNTSNTFICISNADGTGEIDLFEGIADSPSGNLKGDKIAFMDQGAGKIVVGNFNGSSLSNIIRIPAPGFQHPCFNRIKPALYDNLQDYTAVTPV